MQRRVVSDVWKNRPVHPSVVLGLAFAFATAITAVVANLMRHRGAHQAPPVNFGRPVRTSLPLFRSRWYLAGLGVAIISWMFHVGALALAPISLAQSVIAAGLVFLAVIADRVFGLEVSRREWIGVALAALGLTLLAATLPGTATDAHSDAATSTLMLYVGCASLVGFVLTMRATRLPTHAGPVMGIATGVLWGASDVTIKAVSPKLADGISAVVTDPRVAVIVVLSVVSLVISARSLQLGPPVTVIALTAAAGNVVTIASGFVVFKEPVPDTTVGVVLRVAALMLVLVAAVLTPPRAETL